MSNQFTVLQIASTYKPAWTYGGPVISTSRLCEALVKTQTDLELLTTSANGKKELEVPLGKRLNIDGVLTTYYRRWIGYNIHFTPGLLCAFLQKHKRFKVIHIHEWWNSVAVLTVVLCKCVGRKPVLTPRGMLSPYTLRSPLKRLFQRWVGAWLLRGTILHATSEQEAAEALELVPGWSHFILPNIIELPALGQYPPAQKASEVFRLVFLSRVHPKKGLENLLAALAQLDFPWHLQVVGTGEATYLAQLQAEARALGIAQQIEWLGWREGAEKFQLLANADLYVLPSQNENFANAALEALSVGTPVLLSAQVGLSAYVRTQALGWIYDGTTAGLLQALQSAYTAAGQRTEIRQKAPSLVLADFGAERIAQQYLAAYQNFGLL
ncbi:XrtY-associated glycosyltransferase XYAG1 [Haliscomenobacter hydrossis]|uniref:Glycosyl transferase group 1 n=1 Tax=Haliscomenobacter hydrossis (strain ATCC 27775 / DSM 1100 / LMG 10767 / O) TaxID=760192 RepID=F4L455_HALH1|nr:glycosyltransferase [Haliscomenobacter hydrossis]AEE50753.1 glycosyl transferase group 1 [Haliscomenobacter hydrossis DSM 1100]